MDPSLLALLRSCELVSQLVGHALSGDTSLLPEGSDWNSAIAQALAQGDDDLKSELGPDMDAWTWGLALTHI